MAECLTWIQLPCADMPSAIRRSNPYSREPATLVVTGISMTMSCPFGTSHAPPRLPPSGSLIRRVYGAVPAEVGSAFWQLL